MDSKLWISLNPASDQVHKHSETALDTLKNGGTESSFPIKVHSVVPRKAWPSVKSYGFTDEVVKMSLVIRKMAGFYGRLKEACSNHPFGAANVVQNPKENRKPLKIKDLRLRVPGAEAPLLLYIEV